MCALGILCAFSVYYENISFKCLIYYGKHENKRHRTQSITVSV